MNIKYEYKMNINIKSTYKMILLLVVWFRLPNILKNSNLSKNPHISSFHVSLSYNKIIID